MTGEAIKRQPAAHFPAVFQSSLRNIMNYKKADPNPSDSDDDDFMNPSVLLSPKGNKDKNHKSRKSKSSLERQRRNSKNSK